MEMSVASRIKGLALINIEDIFRFTISAKDSEIEDRYGSEERAVKVAREYIEIAQMAGALELGLRGWSMKYSQPIKDSDERVEKEVFFHSKVDDDGKD